MSNLIITNAEIITPTQTLHDGWLYCRDGTIAALGTGEHPNGDVLDANGATVLAGFIDVHVHGAVGADVMDADADALRKMADYFVTHGVTSFLPTTLTSSHEQTLAALETIADVMHDGHTGATILGAHLEGPYLNPEKCGAQDVEFIRRAERDEARQYLDVGVIRLISLAPEYEANHWLIGECIQRGITVSAAHTAATYEQMQAAIVMGIHHSTHTYNAMPKLHHRDPGGMAALWLTEQVRCELIADNIHVHPAMMDVLYRIKGAEKLILISDAMRATGLGDGTYTLGNHEVTVQNDTATIANGTLAGSILTMDNALRHLHKATNASLEELWRTASLNPAQAVNVAHRKGSIEIGKDADLVLLDADFTVQHTIIRGQVVYSCRDG